MHLNWTFSRYQVYHKLNKAEEEDEGISEGLGQ